MKKITFLILLTFLISLNSKAEFLFDYHRWLIENKQTQFLNKEKKLKKGIYGKASIEDVRELKDEGIETEMIPWIEDKEN